MNVSMVKKECMKASSFDVLYGEVVGKSLERDQEKLCIIVPLVRNKQTADQSFEFRYAFCWVIIEALSS